MLWAETGLTAGQLTVATAEHGLDVGFGDTGSVGLGGITLGGGVDYLTRQHGLTIDNLIAADVVTADGVLRRVDATSESPPGSGRTPTGQPDHGQRRRVLRRTRRPVGAGGVGGRPRR